MHTRVPQASEPNSLKLNRRECERAESRLVAPKLPASSFSGAFALPSRDCQIHVSIWQTQDPPDGMHLGLCSSLCVFR